MRHIAGDLVIRTAADAAAYADVTSVGGSLYIRAEASLPVLTSVGGTLYICAEASLPVLTSVGGTLEIRAEASLPVLTSVGGHAVATGDVAFARIRAVHDAVCASPKALNMGLWHDCDTTHCIAGWGIHLAGEDGYALEQQTSSAAAGVILLGVDAAKLFFMPETKARAGLAKLAGAA